ncbi:MAG: hypothetical protein J0I67_23410 [Bosea sp.]|nr:hypothetical protein [Bosea sp. (in: a-proteobacteria)]
MTLARKITVLLLGYEVIPKTVSTRDRGARFVMAEPICAYLIETERGLVLFDTGVNVDNIRDPVRRESLFMSRGWLAPPIVLPEHDFLAQLAAIGVSPADIGDGERRPAARLVASGVSMAGSHRCGTQGIKPSWADIRSR